MHSAHEITLFAETNFRNQRKRFGIKKIDRERHMYVLGKTGTGKTTLQENMVISDILHGNGVGVIDPHGEFAEKMLSYVPKDRIEDVIYFNPADTDHPMAFNPIEYVPESQRHLVASGLMGVFKKIWADMWSARMEYILNNTILAILETPGSTIIDIMRMYNDKSFRQAVVAQLTDPVVKSFWLDEYASWNQQYERDAVAAIQNKVGQFLSAPIIRHIVGQKKSSFDFRKAMDEKKIVIMNLSKGRIGEDNTKLLGGLLVAKMYLAAMSRVDIPEDERKNFYLYVDEFQNFATESFADILSEARKYHLSLILANQYIAQLEDPATKSSKVKDAVFGNVGTMVIFRVGAEDAEFLEKEFEPEFTANDLVNLPRYTIYVKLMIDGLVSRAFSAQTLPPYPSPIKSYIEDIISNSRGLYSREKSEVSREITGGRDISELVREGGKIPGVPDEVQDETKKALAHENAPMTLKDALKAAQAKSKVVKAEQAAQTQSHLEPPRPISGSRSRRKHKKKRAGAPNIDSQKLQGLIANTKHGNTGRDEN